MFYTVVFLCFVASVFSAPANTDVVPLEKQQPTVIPIISQSDELEPNGTYHFSYETGNGIKRDEISYDKVVPKAEGRSSDSNEGGEDSDGDSDGIHVQIGSYSYTAPDGTLISVRYIADENGFRPVGDHIPRVPFASGGSGEKSGRALKAVDNSESASSPKAVKKAQAESSAPAPLSKAASETKPAESLEAASTAAPGEGEGLTKGTDSETSTTEAGKVAEAASTTESSSESSSDSSASTEGASTAAVSTEAVSTEAVSTEVASTTGSAATTEAPTTPAADASTPTADASTPAAEQSTINAEPATTEAASSTTAGS